MERNVRRLLNRVSLALAAVATASLLHLFLHTSASCSPSSHPLHLHPRSLTLALSPFPKSSCDAASRRVLPPDKHFSKLRSSRPWLRRVASFSSVFAPLRAAPLRLVSNSSHVLCVSAGAGHEVAALLQSGVSDITGVDLVDSPPLVSRADPHNLPFFDSVFDLAFSTGLTGSLFPSRFASEMERTVRRGGAVVLAIDRCTSRAEVDSVVALFKRSSLLEVRDTTLDGSEKSLIIMRNDGKNPT